MNLIKILNKDSEMDRRTKGLNPIQAELYKMAVEAHKDGRSLIIPASILPRRCGKTHVMMKIAQDINSGLLVTGRWNMAMTSEGLKDKHMPRKSITNHTHRGIRVKGETPFYVIDEELSDTEMDRYSITICGFFAIVRSFDMLNENDLIDRPEFKRLRDIVSRSVERGEFLNVFN